MPRHESVDAYLASLPDATRSLAEQVRGVVKDAVPGGTEVIRYDMPTVAIAGRSVVHWAAWTKHLAIYPGPAEGTALDGELAPYRQPKGTLSFPFAEPLPLALIGRTVALLVEQRAASLIAEQATSAAGDAS